ncbi:MAG: polysaccharide biosynthesis tyrosine autokinase [Lacipirellulaceae bacterium]
MSIPENNQAAATERTSALVEAGAPAGPGAGPLVGPMPSPFGAFAPQGQDVLRGGMDRSGFLHSLRRRWLLATCMGTLLGATSTGLLYWLLPETNTARAMYNVKADPMSLLGSREVPSARDFETFKKTQLAYVKSDLVLNTALREQAINGLEMFSDVDDKVDWLTQKLDVQFPNDGELLVISMSGPFPKADLKRVIEAVSKAYFDEVVFLDKGQRRLPLQTLRQTYAQVDSDVREKLTAYQQLARDSGTSEAYEDGIDPQTQLMMTEVQQLQHRKNDLKASLADAQMQFTIVERQVNDPSYQDRIIDEALEEDPQTLQMQQEMMYLDMQVRMLKPTLKAGSSPAIKQLEQQRDQISQEIAQRREQMRASIVGEQSNEPNPYVKAASTEFQVQRALIQRELDESQKTIDKLQEELQQKAERNTDLITRMAEIERLRKSEEVIADRIQGLQVELDAPDRISAVGSAGGAALASTRQSLNRTVRLSISGLGGLGAALLSCLGIGYMEFRNRHLDSPEQIDEGLGIRVIGTLPALGGKALNPRHPIVGQLNESIDSVRTALMHESTTKRRRVVLVASAVTMEGRTTVASQLAASLARAGRRTLLVDGDLRSPSLHTLFGTPLEDGICEVLRAEAELADVVRPTQAEGLWLMTAGYCDGDAVQALATDQLEPIFEHLRNYYDFVIIDGAPVLGVSDSLLFGQHCDGVILSVLRDSSNVPKIHKACEMLRSVGIRMIGAVVNGVRSKADRRVTHLQQVTPKSASRQLETVVAEG